MSKGSCPDFWSDNPLWQCFDILQKLAAGFCFLCIMIKRCDWGMDANKCISLNLHGIVGRYPQRSMPWWRSWLAGSWRKLTRGSYAALWLWTRLGVGIGRKLNDIIVLLLYFRMTSIGDQNLRQTTAMHWYVLQWQNANSFLWYFDQMSCPSQTLQLARIGLHNP